MYWILGTNRVGRVQSKSLNPSTTTLVLALFFFLVWHKEMEKEDIFRVFVIVDEKEIVK